jgi:hypothetical protein
MIAGATIVAARGGTLVGPAAARDTRVAAVVGSTDSRGTTRGVTPAAAGSAWGVAVPVPADLGVAPFTGVAVGSTGRTEAIVGSDAGRVAVGRVDVGRGIVTTARTTASTVLSGVG